MVVEVLEREEGQAMEVVEVRNHKNSPAQRTIPVADEIAKQVDVVAFNSRALDRQHKC